MAEEKKSAITLNIVREPATGPDGKEIADEKGEKQYKRDDYVGLVRLLNRFDSKLHTLQEYRTFLKMKDIVMEAWTDETLAINLTLDEATFLKDFLKKLPEREGQQARMAEFELRTLVGILDQLE